MTLIFLAHQFLRGEMYQPTQKAQPGLSVAGQFAAIHLLPAKLHIKVACSGLLLKEAVTLQTLQKNNIRPVEGLK